MIRLYIQVGLTTSEGGDVTKWSRVDLSLYHGPRCKMGILASYTIAKALSPSKDDSIGPKWRYGQPH